MRRLALFSVVALTLIVAIPVSAATPASGTVTVPTSAGVTVTDKWTGTAPTGANPSSSCFPGGLPVDDEHALTINVADGTYSKVNASFTFKITWTPASGSASNNDLILTLLDPSGLEVASSDGSTPSESLTTANLAAGTYRVVVCGFANTTDQPYSGVMTLTTSSLSGGSTGTGSANILKAAGTKWTSPSKVTPTNGYGYEPSFIVDSYGNAFATAHKENWQLALAPDANSPTQTRSMSWAWLSSDKGATWQNPPGLTPLSVEQHLVGDEGDMAQDDASHIYYADTYAGDITLTRWTTNGLGQVTYDFTRPTIPTPEDDDRPWITAHGNGHVFYFSNAGNKALNGGRYTVHASYDGGVTWDSIGVPLPDSGWCRPAADHRAGSKLVYAFCTNDGGKLYAYVSRDDGRSFTRYDVGTYNSSDTTSSYPYIEVGPDGTVWALYDDSNNLDADGVPVTNQLYLFKSTDQGKTWSKQNVTPVTGRYQFAWLALSRDGKKLGFGTYYRPNADFPWEVAAVTWSAGSKPSAKNFLSLDPKHPVSPMENAEPPGDYMGAFFFPDGKLGVIWTRYELWSSVTTLERSIYFARQR